MNAESSSLLVLQPREDLSRRYRLVRIAAQFE
jgi:hypothetical protein